MGKVPVEILDSWSGIGLDVLSLGILSERLEDLERRYGTVDENELFWGSFSEMTDRAGQLYFDISVSIRVLHDYYREGVLPSYAETSQELCECV